MDFVTVSTAGWDDPWVLGLDLEHHHVWNYLIHGPDIVNGHGFAERNPVLWPIRMKLPFDRICTVLQDFERDGRVALDGEVVWVIRHIHHARLGGLNCIKALERIDTQYGIKVPEFVEKCWEMYHPKQEKPKKTRGIYGVYTGGVQTDHIRTDQNRTDHSFCPSSDEDAPHKGRKRKPEDKLYVDLANQIADEIDALVEKYNAPHGLLDNRTEESARQLRLLLENDNAGLSPTNQIKADDIVPMLRYSWATVSGKFSWGPQLLSIKGWRSKDKFRRAWGQWKKRGDTTQLTEREAAERRREERGL